MSGDDQRQQFRRLAISDLLVLTLCVGFALACGAPGVRSIMKLPGGEENGAKLKAIILAATDNTATGIALFGLVVLVRERVRGKAVPSSPGHWILVTIAPTDVLKLVKYTMGIAVFRWETLLTVMILTCISCFALSAVGLQRM